MIYLACSFFLNNAILFNITSVYHNYIELSTTARDLIYRGIKFSWPVAHENLT